MVNIMSPLEKVKNQVTIQNTLTSCQTSRLINMLIKIEIYNVVTEMRLLISKMKVDFLKSYFFKWAHIIKQNINRFRQLYR